MRVNLSPNSKTVNSQQEQATASMFKMSQGCIVFLQWEGATFEKCQKVHTFCYKVMFMTPAACHIFPQSCLNASHELKQDGRQSRPARTGKPRSTNLQEISNVSTRTEWTRTATEELREHYIKKGSISHLEQKQQNILQGVHLLDRICSWEPAAGYRRARLNRDW